MRRIVFYVCTLVSMGLMACAGQPEPRGPASQSAPPPSPAQTQEPLRLRFAASPQGGSWYPLAVSIVEAVRKDVPYIGDVAILPGGGTSNVIAVDEGKAEIGLSLDMSVTDAWEGRDPFEKQYRNVRHILNLYPHVAYFAVAADSPIRSIADLKGKRISVGPKGLAAEFMARITLEAHGLTFNEMARVENLGFEDSVGELKDGRIDAFVIFGSLPFVPIQELAQTRPTRLLGLSEDKLEKILAKYSSGIMRWTIPGNSYKGQSEPVLTLASNVVLVANAAVSESVVTDLTRAIRNHWPELQDVNPPLKPVTLDMALRGSSIPRHPGAERGLQD